MKGLNNVLDTDVKDLPKARVTLFHELRPCKYLTPMLETSAFTDGSLVKCPKVNVLDVTPDAPGFMTCSICKRNFKFQKVRRAVGHLLSATHNRNVAKHVAASSVEASKQLLEQCQTECLGELCVLAILC